MRAAFSKIEIESEIAGRFGKAFNIQEKRTAETLSSGVAVIDSLTGGIPRGAISEISGPASSGRTSLMLSILSYATAHDEICALVDTNDAFAPTTAATAGIDFDRLLWIRCAANLEHSFKATDLLLHAGGFGVVILDMGDVAGKDARRIISSWWYRFRRTVENKPTAIIVISEEGCTRSCASLALELDSAAEWSKTNDLQRSNQPSNVLPMRNQVAVADAPSVAQANLLRINSIKITRRRPVIAGLNAAQVSAMSF